MFLQYFALCLAVAFSLISAVPVPEPGGWGGSNEHHIIHVPYNVHHVHHYHKVPVYIKSKPIVIAKSHGWSSSDWAGSSGWDWD